MQTISYSAPQPLTLVINGPNSLLTGETGAYTASVTLADGTMLSNVSAVFSMFDFPPALGEMSFQVASFSAGTLTAIKANGKKRYVTVEGCYSTGSAYGCGSKDITISPKLASIAIIPPANVDLTALPEATLLSTPFTANARYTDGYESVNVFAAFDFKVNGSTIATYAGPLLALGTTSTGNPAYSGFHLLPPSVGTNTGAMLSASYMEGGITKTASLDLTIANSINSLASISINGPATINENSSGSYTVIATYDDGTVKDVTASVGLYSTLAAPPTRMLTAKYFSTCERPCV